jgi:hypothetical protein
MGEHQESQRLSLRLARPEPGPDKEQTGKTIGKSHLVNRLNYQNFQDQTVLVGLRHVCYDNAITLRARPKPCAGERLECSWAEAAGLKQLLENYRFDYLLIPDGKKYLLVHPEVTSLTPEGMSCVLPSSCREFHLRKIRRHPSSGVAFQLTQHAALLQGEVLDFTPVTLRAEASAAGPEVFYWINPEQPVQVRLTAAGQELYSGSCEILWQSRLRACRTLVLRLVTRNLQRFKAKAYRNARQRLIPSPNLVFEHPVIGRRVNLKIADLSGSGLSVEEDEEESVLMPGLIIPELRLNFAQGVSLSCRAQVVFRNPVPNETGEGTVRCGLAILDMDLRDQVKLLALLHQAANQRSYVGTEVDLDQLWNFFFETGFIYPEKYAYFQANKEQIKNTYAKLYEENPHIARHFTYQNRGSILGHLAMVRFYHDSWLIHHHAARKSVSLKAGLAVLEQVSQYLNELGNFHAAHLRFVFCYYRPDNRFPNRIFGGFARQQLNPQVCSLDEFGYARFSALEQQPEPLLPPGWELAASSRFDLNELASFYRFTSHGLMLEAFDLLADEQESQALAREYGRLGFRKQSYRYSLRQEGSLKAFFLVNCTDAGFNMADLTNCVTLVVLDPGLAAEPLQGSLQYLSRYYDAGAMPVLTYPLSYLQRHGLPCEKSYQLWILNLQYTDRYFNYCDGLYRTVTKPAPGDGQVTR